MKNILLLLLFCVLISCKNEKSSNTYSYNLKASEIIKSFVLDSDVKYNAFYLYTFSDDKGKEYLTFLNYRTNQILFYDLETTDFLFKLNLNSEGPHGVVQPTGLYVKDLNHIYVSSYVYSGLMRVDTTCHIIQKIPYGITSKGYNVLPSYTPSSHPYIAPVIIDKKIYITQNAIDRFHPIVDTPLSVVIDTVQKSCEDLPLTYGILTEKELAIKDPRFSRVFNGKEFIYSFYVSEDIVVTSVDHSEVKKISVKSKYLDSFCLSQDNFGR